MKPSVILASAALFAIALFLVLVPKWTHPLISSVDYGPAAGEMSVFKNPRAGPGPKPQPDFQLASLTVGGAGGGAAAMDAGSGANNLQVLRGISQPELMRTMQAITAWVSPKEGCGFCHAGQNYAADTPRIEMARRMIAMTRIINANWTNHVGATGVTCYTCHRGRNIPEFIWHTDRPLVPPEGGLLGKAMPWNTTAKTIRGFFPNRPDRMFLLQGLPAHDVQSVRPLATTDKPKFEHDRDYAEQVYILMMQMSEAIGVNCTYCHQSRVIMDWAQSPPNRLDGYSGIKLTLMLNQNFFEHLKPWAPKDQLGRMGDAPKADCKTCHYGLEKPVGGMVPTLYPALIGPVPAGPGNPVAAMNPDIPELARAPRVGHPETAPQLIFRGIPQQGVAPAPNIEGPGGQNNKS